MTNYLISERNNLFEPNVYIAMVVRLSGNISVPDLVSAINCAYQNNEATRSKIVLETDGTAYYSSMEKSGCKVIIDNRDWRTIYTESRCKPFEINQGEFIRSYIICDKTSENPVLVSQSDKSSLTLFILAHHLVGDGKSIVCFLEDIINSLNGKVLEYKPLKLINQEYLINKITLKPIVRLFVHIINKKWAKQHKVFTWEDYYRVHKLYWSKPQPALEIKSYTIDEINAMKTQCNNGITLNSYLITKLLQEHPEYRVTGMPVSIRDTNKCMSNQTSGVIIHYRYDNMKSFKENLSYVHKELYKLLNSDRRKYFVLLFMAKLAPTLIDAVQLEAHGCYTNKVSYKLADIMGYINGYRTELGVTNLTKINIPTKYDSFSVNKILFIPPKISYSKNIVGISTFNNEMNMSCLFCD